MTPIERKVAFRAQATRDGKTLSAAAQDACGCTLFHVSGMIAGTRAVSAEVKQRFANYIGLPVEEVFPPAESAVA